MTDPMVEELVTDLVEWKVLLKKNVWRKWYCKSSAGEERVEVVDMFCASFATVNHSFIGSDDYGVGSYNFMRDGNRLAENLASLSKDHHDGWKLHRDWFKCMIAQLAIEAAKERDAVNWDQQHKEENRTMSTLISLFSSMKWDLPSAVKPVGNGVTKVEKVWYNYIDKKSGTNEQRFYFIILEPTNAIPLKSVYEARSGKLWSVDGLAEDGSVKLSNVDDCGVKISSFILTLTPKQIYGMRRVD